MKNKKMFAVVMAVSVIMAFTAGFWGSKVYKKWGGDTMCVADGGEIEIIDGGIITDDGVQASAIVDLAALATYDESGVTTWAALTVTSVNSIITALEGVGILVDN